MIDVEKQIWQLAFMAYAQQSLLEHIAVSAWHWWRMVMERAFYLQNPRLLSCKKEMKRERGIIPCQTMNINKKPLNEGKES